MNLITIFSHYPDHEACIDRLERVRWGDRPSCPKCDSPKVAPKADGHRLGRWNCHACHASFNVLSGTIFQGTRIPLQKWFLAIAMMINDSTDLSSRQLSHDLDLSQPSALLMQQRIRSQMATEQGEDMLRDLVEVHKAHGVGNSRESVA